MWGRWRAITFALALLAAACGREPVRTFSDLDRDGDGRISRAEATANASLERRFAEHDSDEDGELSAIEYLQAARTR